MLRYRMSALAVALALLLALNVTNVRAQTLTELRRLAATTTTAVKVFPLGSPCSGGRASAMAL
jgi:hypothetical protein